MNNRPANIIAAQGKAPAPTNLTAGLFGRPSIQKNAKSAGRIDASDTLQAA